MSKPYKITCDLFTIPYKGDISILYAPKVGYLCEANSHVINLLSDLDQTDTETLNEKQLTVLKHLEENGILNGSEETEIKKIKLDKFTPTRVTLFPTNQWFQLLCL